MVVCQYDKVGEFEVTVQLVNLAWSLIWRFLANAH